MITLKKLKKKTRSKNTFDKFKTPYWLNIREGYDLAFDKKSYNGKNQLFLSGKLYDSFLAGKILEAGDYPVTDDRGITVGKINGVTVHRIEMESLTKSLDISVAIDAFSEAGKRLMNQINHSNSPFSIGVKGLEWDKIEN